MKIQRSASVHPQTITEFSKGEVKVPTKKRAPKTRVITVRNIKVDARVWHAAKRLARGDMRRIKVISSTEVIVQNPREA